MGCKGLLVTPKFGPRVRLAKVITDMPLSPDFPISFGVREFCEACMLCAKECPSGAITKGPRTWEGKSPSNNPGVLKWYVEPVTDFIRMMREWGAEIITKIKRRSMSGPIQ